MDFSENTLNLSQWFPNMCKTMIDLKKCRKYKKWRQIQKVAINTEKIQIVQNNTIEAD